MSASGHLVRRRGASPGSAGYWRDAHGVFSTRLYSGARSAAIVAEVRKRSLWEVAQVVIERDGGTVDLILPESRDAYTVKRERTEHLHEEFEARVDRVVRPLLRRAWGVELGEQSGTQMVRYTAGGHYVAHTDADEADLASRYFTVLCYLNDDFTGGETSFPSLQMRVTPVAGKVLVFPSRFWHCAEPVIRGEKFVFLTWMCGPVPVKWI